MNSADLRSPAAVEYERTWELMHMDGAPLLSYHGRNADGTARLATQRHPTPHACDDDLACTEGCTCYSCSEVDMQTIEQECSQCPSAHCRGTTEKARGQ